MLSRVLSSLIRRPDRGAAIERRWDDVVEQAEQALTRGDLQRAQTLLENALHNGCESARVRRMLGSILGAGGHLERARVELERALDIEPDHSAALTDLGNVHRLSGRTEEARTCYLRALSQDPDNAAIRFSLATIDDQAGRTEAAIGALRSLIEYPAYPEAVRALAEILDRIGQAAEAKSACLEILSREPDHALAHAVLGFLLLKRDLQPRQALERFDRAIALGHADAELWSNRGIALQDLGRLDEAIGSYETALRIKPDHRLAAFHRSLALLMRSDFARAWPDYELRLLSEDRPKPPRSFPAWDGESLPEGALFVHGEQGIGDEIMFASCLPDLLAIQPATVIACTAKLEPIFRRSFPGAKVISLQHATEPAADSQFADVKAMTPIGSMPRHFRPSRESFPRHTGYLVADPRLVEEYRARLGCLGAAPKIGISWRGGSILTRQALRTLDAEQLAQLLSTPGVQFVDLQYDSRPQDDGIEPALTEGKLVHWQDALDDYDRTAALVCALDSIVSVCTALIHLGGALGRPVLVMAPHSPEWRYGISGESMPWYPSVRIERQPTAGDWDSVVLAVQRRLAALT
ncbi:MAG: tetratricopeptide repeat protein [Burkholderiales bacterium]